MKDTIGRENRRLADRSCPQCGVTFRPPRGRAKYCSLICRWANTAPEARP